MKNKLFPKVEKNLVELGDNLKLARLRRDFSMKQVAERAGVSRSTMGSIEKGSPSVSLGSYMSVLFVLNLEDDILKVGADDIFGRKLQDIGLITKKRAPRR